MALVNIIVNGTDTKREYTEIKDFMSQLTDKLQEVLTAQVTAAATEEVTKAAILSAITDESAQIVSTLNGVYAIIQQQQEQIAALEAQLEAVSPEVQALIDQIKVNADASVVNLDQAIEGINNLVV